jgi:hypothetical protein
MGEEFFASGEYGRCLILCTHVVHEFGGERWGGVLDHAGRIGLRAAEAAVDPVTYLLFAVVLLKVDLRPVVSPQTRATLWQNIQKILQKKAPLGLHKETFRELLNFELYSVTFG